MEPNLGLTRVRPPRLAATAFADLCDRIISGELAPGTAMSERQLCAELGVSRTAVREAIARLEQVRLVAVRHGGETRVLDFEQTAGLDLLRYLFRSDRAPSAQLVRSGIEMRAALAPEVARLAALRRTDEVPEILDARVAQMVKKAREPAALQELSLEFWRDVVTAADNLAYTLAFNSLRDALAPLRKTAGAALATEYANIKGYEAIAAAIRAGDADAAARAAQVHIAIGLRALGVDPSARRKERSSRKSP